jgi:hypothetical protein
MDVVGLMTVAVIVMGAMWGVRAVMRAEGSNPQPGTERGSWGGRRGSGGVAGSGDYGGHIAGDIGPSGGDCGGGAGGDCGSG